MKYQKKIIHKNPFIITKKYTDKNLKEKNFNKHLTNDKIQKRNILNQKNNSIISKESNILNKNLKKAKFSMIDLNKKLNILKSENKNMNEEINILKASNNDLNYKLNILYKQNDELNNFDNNKLFIFDKNYKSNKLDLKNTNSNIKFRTIHLINSNKKNRYKLKNKKNVELQLIKKEKKLKQLKMNNDYLIEKRKTYFQNKNLVISDLKNTINILRSNLYHFQEEKNIMREIFERGKLENKNQIDDLSKILTYLNNENEKLYQTLNTSKNLTKKLEEEKYFLINKIKNLTNNLNEININIKNKNSYFNKDIYNIKTLKKENNDLKELKAKYKKIIFLLLQFINELNDLYEYPEINIEDDISLLKDNINQLIIDIIKLFQIKENNNE